MKHLILILFFLVPSVQAEVLKLHYPDFIVWVDCDRNGAVKFEYYIGRDTSNA